MKILGWCLDHIGLCLFILVVSSCTLTLSTVEVPKHDPEVAMKYKLQCMEEFNLSRHECSSYGLEKAMYEYNKNQQEASDVTSGF